MKNIRPVALAVIGIILSLAVQAQYTLTDADVVVTDGVITNYTGVEVDIIIPNILDGHVITSIGQDAFAGNSLITLDLSELIHLITIGDFAFAGNSLTTVDLSGLTNLMTIGVGAFAGNSLTTTDFSDLTNLTTIEFGAFSKNSLTTLDLSGLTNLTIIGENAFRENLLTTINFSDLTNLTTIGDLAFYENSLTTVDFSGLIHLTAIGSSAFSSNRLASANFSGLTHLKTIARFAFYNNSLTTVDLSNLSRLTAIGPFAFFNNSLISFALPLAEGYIYEWQNSDSEIFSNGDIVDDLETNYQAEFQEFSVYTTTYNADGGSHDNTTTYTVEDALTFTAATKEGYTFEGWFTDENFTTEITEITAGTTGDLALFAKFIPLDYTITYYSNGGLHDNTINYMVEDALTFTAATKEGYTFEGWFTGEGFTMEITEITAGTTGNLALFAKYTLLDYAITYHSNGGLHDNATTTFTIEDALAIRAATKAGYIFEGWFTDENFTTEITEIAVGTTGDLALFAKYSEIVLGLIDRDELVLYPNPVTHSFSINQPIDQVNVLNLGGQVVHTFRENQIRYDVSHLAPGQYIVLSIKAGKPLAAKKIIVAPGVP